ncbi:Lacal_2735 family protein [Winogradskyella sp. 3972H.M.0a.05]|uniref:Lacal_2735 family protein n=1 Tax=Winogradskyella sp. 3972H.M.0a.05 TaxID=2950277 RepID=UPI003396CAD4
MTHFCKVNRNNHFYEDIEYLKFLEQKYLLYIEQAYNLAQTDASLSDILYFEAKKLKKSILSFKYINSPALDVVF